MFRIKPRFSLRRIKGKNREAWEVSGYNVVGKQIRKRYQTRSRAEAEAQALNLEFMKSEVVPRPTRLAPDQLTDAESAISRLSHGSLSEAVEFWEKHHKDVVSVSLKEGIDRFIDSKRIENLRPRSIQTLRNRLGNFAKAREEKPLQDVTFLEIKDWVHEDSVSIREKINRRSVAINFFKWASNGENRLLDINPAENLLPIKSDDGEPEVLTLIQVKRLLKAAKEEFNGDLLPYFAIALFGGHRPSAIAGMTWEDVDLEEGTIRFRSEISKLRERRVQEIPENLKAILSKIDREKVSLYPNSNFRKRFEAIRRVANIERWPNDVMRHTALSMMLTYTKDENATAYWAGNSPTVLHKKYKGLVKPSEAKSYWELRL